MSETLWIRAEEFAKRSTESIIISIIVALNIIDRRKLSKDKILSLLALSEKILDIARRHLNE